MVFSIRLIWLWELNYDSWVNLSPVLTYQDFRWWSVSQRLAKDSCTDAWRRQCVFYLSLGHFSSVCPKRTVEHNGTNRTKGSCQVSKGLNNTDSSYSPVRYKTQRWFRDTHIISIKFHREQKKRPDKKIKGKRTLRSWPPVKQLGHCSASSTTDTLWLFLLL